MKYYSPKKIDQKEATYNVVFGERSNGKTFALLRKGIKAFHDTKKQMGYVRRWKEDLTGRRAATLFNGVVEAGEVAKLTEGEYTGITYYAGKWYLCNFDENNKAIYNDADLFCYAFALSDMEHNKSTSYPNIDLIVFDEFLTNSLYLQDEFVIFMNTISTIVRRRDGVKIYMLGNTVNKFCPYFKEMGLTNIAKMEQGTIDVYRYGSSPLKVAVEYCAATEVDKDSDSHKYFAFNNPKLSMITGGAWELAIYPHIPVKYKPKDVLAIFFIDFSDQIFQCEVVGIDDLYFVYIHQKTTPIKNHDDLVYCLEPNVKPNYNRSVYKPVNKLQTRIKWFFDNDKVFYQDNHVGDAVANYLKYCKRI